MNDLIERLRVSAEPVGKLLLEAADALQAAQARIAELTETLRAMVEIGNSQRSRELADVKKTLTKARALLSAGFVVAPRAARPREKGEWGAPPAGEGCCAPRGGARS